MDSDADYVSRFESYVSSIEAMAVAALRPTASPVLETLRSDLLDGQAGVRLREIIPMRARKKRGAFFSNSGLRAAAIAPWSRYKESTGPTLDPAVGAGDLLIEVARQLPVYRDLKQTLQRWGHLLHGRDIEPAFVRLAKARLVLLAVSRGATANEVIDTQVDDLLPEIKVGDGLDLLNKGWSGEHIVMNPPFTYSRAPDDAKWARGRTSLAGIFLAKAVESARPGARLTAILPDVIRAGSRYGRLRSLVGERLHISAAEVYGQFDAWTDVDVFILRGVVGDGMLRAPSVPWWHRTVGDKLGDKFDVCVGTVVPHRDRESDITQPYLDARAVPLGGDFDVCNAARRGFQKRVFRPPFVVVRRTSRPGDKSRGIGTLICGTGGVLVENHLIVLKPKDGTMNSCRRVIELLESARAKSWLDERIRCRHLTIGALREMAWFDS